MKKLDVEKIMQIINEANPLGLFVDNESNFDEFKGEAEEIKKKIESVHFSKISQDSIQEIVDDVFHSYFEGITINQKELDEVTKGLFKELNK